ncbi:MAG: twin-arginine translocation signal domain-containing protein, partial [Phycisphaerales bacterium]|nr:twin-arginine translocation signal domain-containing protein [Phycisphaerales bacterium]
MDELSRRTFLGAMGAAGATAFMASCTNNVFNQPLTQENSKMSERKTYSTIEDAINDLLEGEHKENALNLAAYLKENNMSPNMTNWGKVRYNGEYNIGRMGIEGKNNWCFEVFSS